ncbi:MAG: hypothetical protein JO129_03255 [Candidatus Dependentiae bacterium]|nr:hypothetical protein [Candidatus Dependentiae bacterium]
MKIIKNCFFIIITTILCLSFNPLDSKPSKSKAKSGVVILLNGTSSAGKSTLVKELQKIYNYTLYVASIDDFMMTREGYNPKTRYPNFYNHIKEMALSGKNIVVDTVQYQREYERYDEILEPCNVIKILVYCPLSALIVHVQKRNQLNDPRERRTIHAAFEQFLSLYKTKSSKKDIVIDQITTSKIKDALAKAEVMAKTLSWRKCRKQYKTNRHITKEFNLTTSSCEIALTPRQKWDFVINTGIDLPENVALKVYNFVESLNNKK